MFYKLRILHLSIETPVVLTTDHPKAVVLVWAVLWMDLWLLVTKLFSCFALKLKNDKIESTVTAHLSSPYTTH